MPHATASSLGLQAIILCGPGEGLNPFNSNPADFPKALIPIANRPMIWYSLEWCHRAAVSSITLITPSECAPALEAALSQNPYLTALPSTPRITILSPPELDLTSGTAEIFQLPEVQDAIVGDFVVLSCDLVCELSGRALWETWLLNQPSLLDQSSEHGPQKGGMGVWYDTRDANENGVGVKKEETDFLATFDIDQGRGCSFIPSKDTLQSCVREVAIAMPTDTLNDELQEKEHLRVRSQLLQARTNVEVQTKTRDAHMYFMPHWSKVYLKRNERFESFGEDAVGSWAKSRWRKGLDTKIGLTEALRPNKRRKSGLVSHVGADVDELDLNALSSTGVTDLRLDDGFHSFNSLGSRSSKGDQADHPTQIMIPPFFGYVHPALFVPSNDASSQQQSGQKQKQQQQKGGQQQQQPHPQSQDRPPSTLIRRVDTTKLLLSVSLYLARLPSIIAALASPPSANTHPFCHSQQVHPTSALPSQATIPTHSVLIDANCTLQSRITIRDSVIGANCSIASGSRLHGCLLMEGCVIEERVVLNNCILGRRCKVSTGSDLKECSLQDGYVVSEGTNAKGEVLAGFDESADMDDEEMYEGGEIDLGTV